jgi:metallo-beta-lactamase family protein
MKLGFWGAAQQVTGSMFLLTLDQDYKVLIDCGFDFDKERGLWESEEFKREHGFVFPFEVTEINLVLLTHAHVDHSGNLPNLIKEGYEGQILCTAPTVELSELLLSDSARIHKIKLNSIHGRGKKMNAKTINRLTADLYLDQHVRESMERFVGIAYDRRFKVHENLYVTFINAGHLLGAASILIEARENGKWVRIGFSGDLGRENYPLLKDPQPFPEVDYLVCESTYGNRNHESKEAPETVLHEIVQKALLDIPGRLIIPSFSVGRTQSLLYTLNKLRFAEHYPDIRIFTDSPMALKSSRIYEKYRSLLNPEAREFYEENESLFDFENLTFVPDLEGSKALSNHYEPCIIISSSGMMQGGRIEHHILKNLENPYCTIFMIGFSAEGTTGHQLMTGASKVVVKGKNLEVKASILKTDVFSGHADLRGLMKFVEFQKPAKLKKLFLVHGEKDVMEDFRKTLEWSGYTQAEIPEWGQHFELLENQ